MIQTNPAPYTCNYSGDAPEPHTKKADIFRHDPPEHVRRIALAAPVFAASSEQRKPEIAKIYGLSFEFLDVITKDNRHH